MRWERLDIIGVTVHDLDVAVELYEGIFGVDFDVWRFPDDVDVEELPIEGASATNLDLTRSYRVAIDRSGLFELVEDRGIPAGMRSIHFKVADLEAAGAELRERGLRLVARYRVGALGEAVYEGEAMTGVRMSLLAYEGELVDAIRSGSR